LLTRSSDHVYRSDLLEKYPWLIHGFANRHAGDWPGMYTRVKQIHSDVIQSADNGAELELGKGDAIITRTRGRMVGVRTADCVPIILVDPVHGAVAAVHAGWRGTVQNIAGKTVSRLAAEYDSDPAEVVAVIGPAIGSCCYEVGQEVSEQFRELFPEALDLSRIDLPEANRRELVAAGLRKDSIELSGLCTKCLEEFHSYRRDKEASGRMVAAVGIRKG
jgi:purine-nucleoside/S-methyl-5'-thioadenosine phosphorylase / adenosine deaminase